MLRLRRRPRSCLLALIAVGVVATELSAAGDGWNYYRAAQVPSPRRPLTQPSPGGRGGSLRDLVKKKGRVVIDHPAFRKDDLAAAPTDHSTAACR